MADWAAGGGRGLRGVAGQITMLPRSNDRWCWADIGCDVMRDQVIYKKQCDYMCRDVCSVIMYCLFKGVKILLYFNLLKK
jgi:hypothetical protein